MDPAELVRPPFDPQEAAAFFHDDENSSSDDSTVSSSSARVQPPATTGTASATTPSDKTTQPSPVLPPSSASGPGPDSDEDEDEMPDLYIPALIAPTMFLPIPNTDPLSTLLNKYILPEKRPMRDLTGEWQRHDFHSLVMSNSWRAIARMTRDRLVASNPEEISAILPLWFLRLSCLARLRLFNQCTAECTNLYSVLSSIEPLSSRKYIFDRLVPFELEVLHARLKYWAGDSVGYLDMMYGLVKKCKLMAKIALEEGEREREKQMERERRGRAALVAMWRERGSRIALIIASQFIEMKEFTAATRLLAPLCTSSSPELCSAVGRIYLQAGLLDQALAEFNIVSESIRHKTLVNMNAALMASAQGDWVRAEEVLRGVVATNPDDFVAVNNLGVALLNQGKLKEGIEVLEGALRKSPFEIVTTEPFLFNLSTLYELRASHGMELKKDLLIQVAQLSGDGLRTTCLKMPTN
ncbi:hypothetical protein BDM02DRAFT_3098171 [Thelephora ganbajun]|uniref:Uncharacterized protein n=1 Tax=Thelephora ganbajun TaxID=370292 RepID=A0ACB6ZCU3_THEGA|nr:hypothetical protein BDM02DRAFT_3098171 [Thelephora ganbajun]